MANDEACFLISSFSYFVKRRSEGDSKNANGEYSRSVWHNFEQVEINHEYYIEKQRT